MSLISALNIGRNALAVQQAAIQVTTNNIANAGNENYTRQSANLSPNPDYAFQPGIFLGTGVNLSSVNRQIDNALLQRLRSATSDSTAADANQSWMTRVESVFNALGTNGLSSQMSTFFNSWSKAAGNPQDVGLRQIVVTNGSSLSRGFTDVRRQLTGLREDLDNRITAQASAADDLTKQIAELNGRITNAEGGQGGQANGLRDQRDGLIKKLSGLINVTTTDDKGSLNVFVGSQPLVIGTTTRGVAVAQTSDAATGQVQTQLVFKDDKTVAIPVTGGEIGGLSAAREATVDTINHIDKLAGSLIHELNKLHSSGQGLTGLSVASAGNSVSDPDARLDSTGAGLAFPPGNGSFVLTVTEKSTGKTTSRLIKVDLSAASASPTTLNSLATDLTGTDVTATVTGGQLTLRSNSPDVTFSFSQDTSGALASLGINTFFSGKNAADIAVSSPLTADPRLLAVARNGNAGDNQTALAIASLDTKSLDSLSGLSLRQSYDSAVSVISASTAAAKNVAEGSQVVLETLVGQREALSGVSLDEESINLIKQQRAFQGAARIISTVDELLQTVLNLVN